MTERFSWTGRLPGRPVRKIVMLAVCLAAASGCTTASAQGGMAKDRSAAAQAPNIVLVMTDDQGYGDVGVLGNPLVKTPHIDSLYQESVRFTDFHVDPTCSPTRAALLTGQSSMRAGVWHTVMGRSLLPREKVTMAEHLSHGGYRTAIFGKWHLGDDYPYRPEDQGFDYTLIHGGGGVGQTPDYWGNNQFDDIYYEDGKPTPFKGNSTDVWFDAAEKFLSEKSDAPLFAYVALNSPHQPWRAPDEYVEPYRKAGLPEQMSLFYGMITHVDKRVGQLKKLSENLPNGRPTIFIFMTDNGSSFHDYSAFENGVPVGLSQEYRDRIAAGNWQHNAGMRGYKSSVYEGGHRVPFMISGSGIDGGRDVDVLSAHFDVLPTLLDMAGVKPAQPDFDGRSLADFIVSPANAVASDRAIVVTNQRVFDPAITRPMSVMTERWRYVVHGETNTVELFDIEADPGQKSNVIAQHPDVAAQLAGELNRWWTGLDVDLAGKTIPVGGDAPDVVRLTSMDWMEAPDTDAVPWFPGFDYRDQPREAIGWIGKEDKFAPLPWYLTVNEPGSYQIDLLLHDKPGSTPINAKYAILEVGDRHEVIPIKDGAILASTTLDLPAGFAKLRGWFADDAAAATGRPAFYVYVSKANLGG